MEQLCDLLMQFENLVAGNVVVYFHTAQCI